jgi:hypothetical protein
MTLAAVWKVGERVYAIADTRISRGPGNVLTEHGPKILPVTLICKQPGQSGDFDSVTYVTTFGFVYAGASLSALSTHALANTLCQNLSGMEGTPPPLLREVADATAKIAFRYMHEIGELAGSGSLFSAIIFGFCIRLGRFVAYEITPRLMSGRLVADVEEHDLYNPYTMVVIGNNPVLLHERVHKERPHLYADPENPLTPQMLNLREIDLPKRALSDLIAEDADKTVGGSIQEAWVTRAGFQPVAKVMPITPAPGARRNMTMTVLGFDMFEFDAVGSYSFLLMGRF